MSGRSVPPARPTVYERLAPSSAAIDHALAGARHAVYWLEDAEPASYPVLEQATAADLVVVGGGYLGLWTAVLAKRRNPGARVVLLEAQTLGWAASGRNGGFCEASLTHGEENGRSRWPEEYDVLDRLGHANLDAFGADVEALGLDCEWERTGSIALAVEDHQVPWLEDEALGRDGIGELVDSPIAVDGSWDRDGCAMVHPAKLVAGLARAASNLGVELFEHSPVIGLERTGRGAGAGMAVSTPRAVVRADRVALATNVFPALLRRDRLMTVPVYDYVLMTEPLTAEQRSAIGWAGRQGIADLANQFHYLRLTADDRILFGGYDAIYHYGGKVRPGFEDRETTYRRLAAHLLVMFPQLEGIRISHRWAGAIDTCTQFVAFHSLAYGGRVAGAAGFTGLGVGSTRFAAETMLDRLEGRDTERTRLAMVRRRPLPFPPEPLAAVGINLTRWSLDRADHRQGERNLFLRTLDTLGLGFDS